ncbi:MAG: hypothetical protein M0042_14270 [Nitrospiraceae bacterium]|nr:hypothetical protein [Nitrospiraceae bacterium]
MKKTFIVSIVVVLAGIVLTGFTGVSRAEEQGTVHSIQLPIMPFDLADGPGRNKAAGYCAVCHGVEYIPMQPKLSKAQWNATVTKMIKAFGAPIPQEDADTIVSYLATAYGTGQ